MREMFSFSFAEVKPFESRFLRAPDWRNKIASALGKFAEPGLVSEFTVQRKT